MVQLGSQQLSRTVLIVQDPAVALVVMVITAAILVPVSAAPTYHQPPTDSTASWWYNACGHSGMVHDHRKHHNRSDKQIITPVKNQMKLMAEKLKKEFGEIKTIYRQVKIFNNYSKSSFDWLPQYKHPNSTRRSKRVLQQFHKQLQHYVVAVNYLMELKVSTEAEFDWPKRNEMLYNIFNQLKMLICEVETAVNATGLQVLVRIPPSYPEHMGMKFELSTLTEMYIVDSGILSKLEKFIVTWKRNLRDRLPLKGKNKNKNRNKKTPQSKKPTNSKKSQNNENKQKRTKQKQRQKQQLPKHQRKQHHRITEA